MNHAPPDGRRHHHLGRMLGPKGTAELLQVFDSQGMQRAEKHIIIAQGKSIWRMTQGLQQIREKGEKEKCRKGAAMRFCTQT